MRYAVTTPTVEQTRFALPGGRIDTHAVREASRMERARVVRAALHKASAPVTRTLARVSFRSITAQGATR